MTTFSPALHRAAQRLIDGGEVTEVRVLQHGRVVTGIAGDRQRVYVNFRGAAALDLEGECTCGETSPCVHVAAVVMTASQRRERSSSPVDTIVGPSAALRQSLCYLIAANAADELEVSVWVTQTPGNDPQAPSTACPFVPRRHDGSKDYPRYVDAHDQVILDRLTMERPGGPWGLAGAAGFARFQQAVATGRCYWRSLQSRALRTASARELRFIWHVQPNGDQRLRCDTSESLDTLLELDPPVYIDTASGASGAVLLPYPAALLRRFWNHPVVSPADVPGLRAALASAAGAEFFPRPREFKVQNQALHSLRPRLVLSAAPAARVDFLYNGLAVDSLSLNDDKPVVCLQDGEFVHHITRDIRRERECQGQVEHLLGTDSRNGAVWLAFMMNGLEPLLALGWEVDVASDFPYRIAVAHEWYADLATTPPIPATRSRGVRQARQWFDLYLGVRVDGVAVNVLPALVHYLRGVEGRESRHQCDAFADLTSEHLLIRLEDGRYLPVPLARIQRIADVLVELSDQYGSNDTEGLRLPASQAGRLASLALDASPPRFQSEDPALLSLIDAVRESACLEPIAAPAQFRATLRPYQEQGLGWLQFLRRHSLGGILADDMGLGKTVQTLAHLAIEKQAGRLRKPALIVAPVSVIGNWQREIRRFAPDLSVVMLQGAKRKSALSAMDSADVVVIGYPLLVIDGDLLLEREFSVVILDEAQTIKNPQTQVAQVARRLKAEHRLCLTGTPMENHLGELWSLFEFLQPGFLGDRLDFQRDYRIPIENAGDTRRAAALRLRIQPFVLRRTKDTVARELPPKIQILQSIELDSRQRDFYDGIRLGQHRRVREAIAERGLARSHMRVLEALLRLRQACCDPRLVAAEDATPGIPSAKLEWLATTLPELIAAGRRILLFSQFTAMLGLIETRVNELSIPYLLLTGETRDRTELVERFQTTAVPLFLISLKAGGTGLNLTAADTIIHFDPWWNPAVEAQATDRAHRIGQDKPVFVYKLIAERTVEQTIVELQSDKHALVSQLYADEKGSVSAFTATDIDVLFAS